MTDTNTVHLTAKSACEGLLPVTVGPFTLAETAPTHITIMAPLNGKQKACTDALQSAFKLALPAVGHTVASKSTRILWSGQGQYMVLCEKSLPASIAPLAAITDQSDVWAVITLSGKSPEEVLARLIPIDLRAKAFPAGRCARAPLGHMNVLITRTTQGFEIMGFRSMAHSLVEELHAAMASVAAARALAAKTP